MKHIFKAVILLLVFIGCSKDESQETTQKTPNPGPEYITDLKFTFNVSGANLELGDTPMYENASGNIFSVSEIKILLGQVTYFYDTTSIVVFDTALLESQSIPFYLRTRTPFPLTTLSKIFIRAGLNGARNISGKYPHLDSKGFKDVYSGGYYALKITGNFKDNMTSVDVEPYVLELSPKYDNAPPFVYELMYAEIVEQVDNNGKIIEEIEIRVDVAKFFRSKDNIANFDLSQWNKDLPVNPIASETLAKNFKNCMRLGSVQ